MMTMAISAGQDPADSTLGVLPDSVITSSGQRESLGDLIGAEWTLLYFYRGHW